MFPADARPAGYPFPNLLPRRAGAPSAGNFEGKRKNSMKKKLLSLALALAACLSLSVPAMAAQKTLYLKQEFEDYRGDIMKEVSPSEANFILTGDVSLKGEAGVGNQKVEPYTSNGSLKIGVQVYTKAHNPRNIYIGSSVGSFGPDVGYTCFDISIYGMKYVPASGIYETETENPVCFDGQLEIYDANENPSIVSIADYYTNPNIISYGPPTLASNASATLSQPGVYLIDLDCDGPKGMFLVEIIGSAAPSQSGFSDVAASSAFAPAINWAVEQKIAAGYGDGTFRPGNTCTVAHILTFLWRASGRPGAGGDERAAATAWAKGLGIDTGNLSAPCTRAMAVTCLWKAAGSPAPSKSASFADVPAGADYARAVSWALEKGITNGAGGNTFSPGGTYTRGQIVTFLYRAANAAGYPGKRAPAPVRAGA